MLFYLLSHAFERITKASLFGSIGDALPFGKILSGLVTLNYSRQNERQSDVVGTRVLATAGYAADGLRNLFVKMQQQEQGKPPEYLSSHPATENRIRELEELIQRNGYNRYAFEGVEKYAAFKEALSQL
jgi:predicted Zn-dependent protease